MKIKEIIQETIYNLVMYPGITMLVSMSVAFLGLHIGVSSGLIPFYLLPSPNQISTTLKGIYT